MPHCPTYRPLVSLLLAALVLVACSSGQSAPNQHNEALQSDSMVLREDRLGPLALSDGKEINQSVLKNTFPNHTVKQKTGTQDGPSYTYYRLGQDGTPVADFRMKTNGSGLERVSVHDSTLSDVYGIHVGTTYAAIKNERPDVKHETGYSIGRAREGNRTPGFSRVVHGPSR